MNTAAFVFKVPERLELAKACGADEVIDINEAAAPMDRSSKVMALTGGRGADIVAEIVGLPAVIPEGIQMVCAGGTYLEVG